ncbi:unnamed protein product [Rotaria sp. Silwood2]|nr:unnamed protein product [Rotaria sp. Silwood2]CAF4123140.1 unnamed protein product [Rotaria sp. Silwood2]
MSDVDSDIENLIPLVTHNVPDNHLDISNMVTEKYQYKIIKNTSQLIKSDVWSTFGFPSKLQNGKHHAISGFVSCSNCYKTLSYDGSTKYMKKHKCLDLNVSISIEKNTCLLIIDKYMGKKVIIQKHDKEKLQEKIVLWSCLSIRPFTIVEDPGFTEVVKEAITLGQKYYGDINVENLITTAKTIGNNVHPIAEDYRRALKPILISQADAGCLCIIPDLWSDKVNLYILLSGGIGYRISNAFIGTVLKAYSYHYPLELSVEDIWVVITQGVGIHLNENAEKYRQFFVSHEGKKVLVVAVDDLVISIDERVSKGNLTIPAIYWPKAVRRMGDLIKANIKVDLATVITQPFSQTTTVQQAVFDACLMDTVKNYCDYRFSILCGIPQVTLLGSSDDFQTVLDRLNQLKIFFSYLHWWLDPLLLHVQKLKESAQGNPAIIWWWKTLYEHSVGCGGTFLTGWIVDFVP